MQISYRGRLLNRSFLRLSGPPLRKLIFVLGIFLFLLFVLIPFSKEIYSNSVLINQERYASRLTRWSGTPPRVRKRASDGALQSYGKKDTFRENLRPDMQYIMTGYYAGWTNDLMMGMNAIYLGLLSNRTPILFPFAASFHLEYVGDLPPSLEWETVFDLPRLSQSIGIPLVEMSELKVQIRSLVGQKSEDTIMPREEDIGAWSSYMLMIPDRIDPPDPSEEEMYGGAFFNQMENDFMIYPHYTPLPEMLRPDGDWGTLSFSILATILKPFPNAFTQAYLKTVPSFLAERNRPPPALSPDNQVAYIDHLYYAGEATMDPRLEWMGVGKLGKVGTWEKVGKYARWNAELEELAKGYLRRTFSVPDKVGAKIPPFISVHIRRGDMGTDCDGLTIEEMDSLTCYTPLRQYADRVAEVRNLLFSQKRIETRHVLVTTDELDKDFLKQIDYLGWYMLNHKKERTIQARGYWYSTLIDAVSLSLGTGFVGTSGSTMSIVARRRVEDWNNGIGRQVMGPNGWFGEDNE